MCVTNTYLELIPCDYDSIQLFILCFINYASTLQKLFVKITYKITKLHHRKKDFHRKKDLL